MNFRYIILSVCLLVILSFTYNDELSRIVNTLSAYTQLRPQEKLYLQLDKPFYAAGENIWFKAYLVNASFHTADSASKIIYVELLNAEKELIHRHLVYSPKGLAHGYLSLSDSLPQGKYIVRAYTNYMKNWGDDFFFLKEINILNVTPQKENSFLNERSTVALQFFPEGGNFLAGVENRIAFKAIDERGNGIFAQGEILDENNTLVTLFNTAHNGMGVLKITPGINQKTYKARLKQPAGVDGFFPLPEVTHKGYLLRVSEEGDNIKVIAYTNVKNFSPKPCFIYLVAQSRGVVTFAARGEIANTTLTRLIPKSKFPSGITQITLFDGTSEPQCERLIFVDHEDGLQCTITTDKPAYPKRSPVTMDITVTDKTSNPIAGNFSLSIYDENKIKHPEKYPVNIVTHLLLTSDLAGKVEEPGYYLKDKLPETKQHLDLLMMTHGWRRFSWKTVLEDSLWAIEHYPEKGIVVSGSILKSLIKKPAVGSKIKILTTQGDVLVLKADSLGKFYSDHLLYYDSMEMVIQTDNAKGKQTELQLRLDPFNPSPELRYFPSLYKGIDAKEFLALANKQNQIMDALDGKTTLLKEIEITGTKIEEQRSTIYGIPSQTIKMDQYMENYRDIWQVLQGRVAGLFITGSSPDVKLSMRGGGAPMIMVDGMQMDIETVSFLPPSDVESIDVIKGGGASVFGNQGGNGVIAINTKSGFNYSKLVVGIHQIKYPGLQKVREFYVPKYDIASDNHDLPDVRTTLYWNPSIKTDSNGKSQVSFFTSDISSNYKIVLEGISNDGVPGNGFFQLKTN